MGEEVGPQVNKPEQFSSDDHLMSLAGVSISRGVGMYKGVGMSMGVFQNGLGVYVQSRGGTPYHVKYPMMYVMLPLPLWTDTCL